MLRFLVVTGLFALAGFLLYEIFAITHSGIELQILAGLLAAGLCLALIALLLKRNDQRPDRDWWRSYIDKDGFDDDL